jgi:DNA-binding transcriptional LysR family regulator
MLYCHRYAHLGSAAMELHQVRYFLALCRHGNFTRAAERCGVRQPSVTRAIRLLEAEFGAPLFERMGRATRLSPLGEKVRPRLASIARSVAYARRDAANFLSVRTVSSTGGSEFGEGAPTHRIQRLSRRARRKLIQAKGRELDDAPTWYRRPPIAAADRSSC